MYVKYPCKLLLSDFHTGQSLKSISELKVSKLCMCISHILLRIYEYIFIFKIKGIVKCMIHREVSKYRVETLDIKLCKCTIGLTFLTLISSAVNQE